MTFWENREHALVLEDFATIQSSELPWCDLRGKRVLVTGAGGFLASFLVKSLLFANDSYGLDLTVICVSRYPSGIPSRLSSYISHSSLHFFCHDLSLPLPLDFPQADIFIHAASPATPRHYSADPVGTLEPNVLGTSYLLRHATTCRANRFLYVSSGDVYGAVSNPAKPIVENDYGYLDPLHIRSCYGESKRMGETICRSWSHQSGIHVNIVRPFHTYGPGLSLDNDGRVFSDFVAQIVRSENLVIMSDGTTRRAFCYLADAISGFLTVLLKGACGEAYNVGNPSCEISVSDLANLLSTLVPGHHVNVVMTQEPSGSVYVTTPVTRAIPCIDKLSRLGWKPLFNLSDGFMRTITFHLRNL